MEPFHLAEFLKEPSCEYLMTRKVRKDDWLALGRHLKIQVKSYWPKQKMVDCIVPVLISQGMVSEEAYDLVTSDVGAVSKTQADIEYERLKLERLRLEQEAEFERLKLEKEKEDRERQAELEKDMR